MQRTEELHKKTMFESIHSALASLSQQTTSNAESQSIHGN